MASRELNIIDGPSKFDLMLAIFDGFADHLVTFKTGDGSFVGAVYQIKNCGAERWIVKGWAWNEKTLGRTMPERRSDASEYTAHFTTKAPRDGRLIFHQI